MKYNAITASSAAEGGGASFQLDEQIGSHVVDLFRKQVGENGDAESFLDGETPSLFYGVTGSQKALVIAAIPRRGTTVIIVPETKDVFRLEEDLHFFLPREELYGFPIVEEIHHDVTFSGTERLRERMRTLSAVMENRKVIVIATAAEIIQKLPRREDWDADTVTVSVGQTVNRDILLSSLVGGGYERVDRVERCGHFSVRGDIVDIFGINHRHPVRVEFFGDEIDGIRFFEETTQRSVIRTEQVSVMPIVRGKGGEESLLSYLHEGTVIYDEPQRCEEQVRRYFREEKEHREKGLTWSALVSSGQSAEKPKNKEKVLSLLQRELPLFSFGAKACWQGQIVANYQRQADLFTADLKRLLQQEWKVLITAPRQSERQELEELLTERCIPRSDTLQAGTVTLVNQVLGGGFEEREGKLAVITAGDIFGKQKAKRYRIKGKGKAIRYFSDLNPGDYVVQQVHGIGRYLGIKTIELDGVHRDYIAIQYAGTDILYLPMEQIATLEKYIGPEGQTPALHKMGGVQWNKVRSKARASIEELAKKLLEVYAKREVEEGIAFDPDGAEQYEFEDMFPFVETPDQSEAIEAVKRAMEKPVPMDMLVCGDVGFGKTEVAMRAVFKCVMSGYQAMVLCPTTVLSRQHGLTFRERMESFGVTVEVLNRFASVKEKKYILTRWERGELDVLIGTHALLSKQIQCRNLGLLVVDEEQRFGVVQKEKWKSLSAGIDVLSLSATPIPRTLHMSLTGVRDMVTMSQPPENRHAIQTYVAEYDDAIVREAVIREKERGGQVYFVYNRIATIHAMEDRLRSLLPSDITVGVAYGQMNGSALEQTMMGFYEGTYDVLLCTTLIENGLDLPNANTMLVYDADRLGLSQIYQMRGRVGRSDKIGRVYFFYRKGKVLSEVAERRLETIREFTELGSGFKIALRDLEIRGAGSLLGSAQHGNMAGVGFAAYCTMLEEAVAALRDKREGRAPRKKRVTATVEFRQDAYLGVKYIESEEYRMEMYRRLAAVSTEAERRDLLDEMIDRFGEPDAAAERLFFIAKIRISAMRIGIGAIKDEGETALLSWADETPMHGWDLNRLPKRYMSALRFLPGSPARVRINKALVQGDVLEWIGKLTEEIYQEIQGETFA